MTPLFVGSRVGITLSASFWWVYPRHVVSEASAAQIPAASSGYVRDVRSQATLAFQGSLSCSRTWSTHRRLATSVDVSNFRRESGVPVDTGPADEEGNPDVEPALMSGVINRVGGRW